MKFKVYNGPMVTLRSQRWGTVERPPKCKEQDCPNRIAVQLSDRWCKGHALEYVKQWDRQNAKQN